MNSPSKKRSTNACPTTRESRKDLDRKTLLHRGLQGLVKQGFLPAEFSVPSIPDGSSSSTSPRSDAKNTPRSILTTPSKPRNRLYKTELCRYWDEFGLCRYGSNCQFAHGRSELTDVSRHPKYKTETCRSFAMSGLCYYGPRCRFLHRNDSTLIPETTNLLQCWNRRVFARRLPMFVELAMGKEVERSSENLSMKSGPVYYDSRGFNQSNNLGHG